MVAFNVVEILGVSLLLSVTASRPMGPDTNVLQDHCQNLSTCAEAHAAVQRAVVETLGNGQETKCMVAHRWGLGSELNQIIKCATELALERNGTKFCIQYPKYWEYGVQTEKVSTMTNCSKLGCFFESLASSSCDDQDRDDCTASEIKLNSRRAAADESTWSLSLLSIRAEATRTIFDRPTAVQADHFQKKASDLLGGNRDYVAAHIRWGDKLREEAQKVEAPRYLEAAEKLAAKRGVSTVLILTSDPDAVRAVQDELHRNPSNLTYIYPNYYAMSSDPLDYISDIMLMTSGKGAVVTFSSNMGRLAYFLRHHSILQHQFEIVSMDEQQFSIVDH